MFCLREFCSNFKVNYPKSLLFALKSTLAFEIHWVMFFLLRCLLLPSLLRCSRWISSRRSRSRDFSASNLPLRGFIAGCWIRRFCVWCCVPFAWEFAWDSPLINIVSQTMNKQVSFFKSLSIECCLETNLVPRVFRFLVSGATPALPRWRKSLKTMGTRLPRNKTCAVTSNYCMTSW